jgi:hypothetical protein
LGDIFQNQKAFDSYSNYDNNSRFNKIDRFSSFGKLTFGIQIEIPCEIGFN